MFFFYEIVLAGFDIDNPHSIKDLSRALLDIERTPKSRVKLSKSGFFPRSFKVPKEVMSQLKEENRDHHQHHHGFLINPHHPHLGTLTLSRHTKSCAHQPSQHSLHLYGVPLTESVLRKFVQRQLLVNCFYLAMLACTNIHMYRMGTMPAAWFFIALWFLFLNLLIVTPITMFLGFSLAGVLNADVKALQEIGKLSAHGESALMYMKVIILDELHIREQAHGDANPERDLSALFAEWSRVTQKGAKDRILPRDIRKIILEWSHENGHTHLKITRPKLLAMMRLIDHNRDGSINFLEFRRFGMACVEERAIEEAQNPVSIRKLPNTSDDSKFGHQPGIQQTTTMPLTRPESTSSMIDGHSAYKVKV